MTATALLFGVFLATMLIGVPIAFALCLGALAVLWMTGFLVPELVVQRIFAGMDSFPIMAIPFFILAGALMETGGISARLVRFSNCLVGWIAGGLAHVAVVASMFFAGISGSAVADTAAISSTMIPVMKRRGFDAGFSAALIAAAGVIGPIIPPSIPMVLYGSIAGVSIGSLFLAGFLPGVLVGLCAAAYCVWYALKNGIADGREWSLAEIVSTSRAVVWTLGAPALIFGGIYGGFMTPTEASMAVSVYAVAVSVFVYRELSWAQVWNITRETALLSAKVFIIVAASGVFSWILTAEQVPQKMVATITDHELSPVMILLMINVVLLIVGMFLDPNSAIVLFTPLLWPIAQHAGVDLIHFGIIFTVNLAIGMFSPPFGLNIFVSCSIFKVPSARVIAGLTPFFLVYLVALAIITYVPALSLYLPRLLMN